MMSGISHFFVILILLEHMRAGLLVRTHRVSPTILCLIFHRLQLESVIISMCLAMTMTRPMAQVFVIIFTLLIWLTGI